jgi:2-oxoglutarate dehydrogenase complex dehydrogenase (E1) component-like enzyme
VIGDDTVNPSKVQRVLICNGQFYYELKAKRDELNREVILFLITQRISLL